MSLKDQLQAKYQEAKHTHESEGFAVSFQNVKKPSKIEEILNFDFSDLDTLAIRDLEKFIGALSQYNVFYTRYVNIVTIYYIIAKEFYEKAVNQAAVGIDGKTVKERIVKAEKANEEIQYLKSEVQRQEHRLAFHKNVPETIKEMIQTCKKVYDARRNEGRDTTH